jgi:2-isopropylmalate synthase
VIRINSQSGKGGVAFVLEQDHGLRLPRDLQIEFSRCVQRITDESGAELTSRGVFDAFAAEYLSRTGPSPDRCRTRARPGRGEMRSTSR